MLPSPSIWPAILSSAVQPEKVMLLPSSVFHVSEAVRCLLFVMSGDVRMPVPSLLRSRVKRSPVWSTVAW